MTKQQLIEQLRTIVGQLINRDELFTSRATCKLLELIRFIEDETNKELDAIHVKTTLALIIYDFKKLSNKSATESSLAE